MDYYNQTPVTVGCDEIIITYSVLYVSGAVEQAKE